MIKTTPGDTCSSLLLPSGRLQDLLVRLSFLLRSQLELAGDEITLNCLILRCLKEEKDMQRHLGSKPKPIQRFPLNSAGIGASRQQPADVTSGYSCATATKGGCSGLELRIHPSKGNWERKKRAGLGCGAHFGCFQFMDWIYHLELKWFLSVRHLPFPTASS